LCQRNTVEPGSVFDRRAKDSYAIFKAQMETQELEFDTRNQRVTDKTRATNVFKISRA
jgi:hypothetical protein